MAGICFRLFNPYAFAGPHWYNLQWSPIFLENLATLKRISQPFSGFPPSLQWAFRTPWLFSFKNAALWGLGVPFFLAAGLGVGIALKRIVQNRQKEPGLLLLWTFLCPLVFGVMPNQTMRYLLPVYPMAAVFAAFALIELREKIRNRARACWPLLLVLMLTLGWALSFTAIYRNPMTRIAASKWIYDHVPAGARLMVEQWDDALPLPLPGTQWNQYQKIVFNPAGPETEAKRRQLINNLTLADYIVISSNRNFAAITRLPGHYPLTSRYYELLFGNLARFSLAAWFTSFPRLGPLVIADDEAEEAFTVYDHPRVFIFKKEPSFSANFLEKELNIVHLPAAGSTTDFLDRTARPALKPVTPATLLKDDASQMLYLGRWILLLGLLGMAGRGISRRLFPQTGFPARSLVAAAGAFIYGLFLKIGWIEAEIGILLLTMSLLWLGLMTFLKGEPQEQDARKQDPWPAVVFWSTSALFLLFRAHNPAIAWGERPFDFALLNTMMRTGNLPPMDPWISGNILHYHAWGQFFIGFLGRIAHLPPAIVYNLGAALVPALAAELIFWAIRFHSGRILSAIIAIVVVFWSGNFSAWFQQPWKNGWSFQDFWQASRIVPDTINEFPFWTALFADLHGHFIGLIFSAQFIAALFLLDRLSPANRWWAGLLGGLAGGWLALTNPWAVPVYLLLLTLWLMTKTSLKEAAPGLLMIPTAMLCAFPFWAGPAGVMTFLMCSSRVTATELFVLFGPFLAVYLLWMQHRFRATPLTTVLFLMGCAILIYFFPSGMVAACIIGVLALVLLWRKAYTDRTVITYLLLITSLMVIVGGDIFTVVDRMNTIFKLYFETWILLGLGAALAFDELWANRQKTLPAVVISLTIFACGLLTSFTTFISWWDNPVIENQSITFNGLRFLAARPDEAMAVAWLNNLEGQPTIAEAAGPSYEEFGRFSSRTGLPTVIGWKGHVFQHGHSFKEIESRYEDLKSLYQNGDKAKEIIERYNIQYGIIGQLEKMTYGDDAGRGWENAGWRLLFKHGTCEIWGNPEPR